MYFKFNNHLETVEIERERNKGCIQYHGILEASRQTDTLEGLRFGTDVMFESLNSFFGKFAGVGVQTAPPTYKEGKKSIQLDHTLTCVIREENNANDVGNAKDPMLKRHCFIDLKFNKITNELEIRSKYERVKLTTSFLKEAWIIDLFTINS
jgi:hypothetical protein